MRKIIFIVGGLVSTLFLAALVLPFVIDLERFKPQVQAAVSDAVNAELEFDSIRLQILTGLGVRLKNVTLTNTDKTFKGTRLFHVDDLDFRVDLTPLLQGRFEGYLSIAGPEITIVNDGVRSNATALTKPSAKKDDPETPAETDDGKPAPSAEEIAKQEAMIEELKGQIVIRKVVIDDARFLLRPLASKEAPVTVEDLDIDITDIALEQDIQLLLSTDVAVQQDGIQVKGPIEMQLTTKVMTQGSQFTKATFQGGLNFDKLAINAMDAFVKRQGIALNVAFSGKVQPDAFHLDDLTFNLHNLAISSQAKIDGFVPLKTSANLSVVNNDLKGLGEVLPQHKQLLSQGRLKLDTQVDGLLSDLKKLALKTNLDVGLTGSDLRLAVDAQNLKDPVAKVNVASQRLDLQAILGPFMPETPEGKGQGPKGSESAKAQDAKTSGSDTDENQPPAKDFALSAEQRQLLQPAKLSLDVDLREILFDTLQIKNLQVRSEVANLKAKLDRFAMDIFAGKLATSGQVDLGKDPLAFSGLVDMDAVETREMIALIKPEHKDTLQGKANFDLTVEGSGTTVPTLSKTLNGKGSFAFLDGQVNSTSIAGKMGEQLDSYMSSASITGSAEDLFSKAEAVLNNPVLKKAGVSKKLDIGAKKKQYATSQQLKISDKLSADSSLKDVKGELEIKDGKIHITSNKASDSGGMDMDVTVALDTSLGGQAVFQASDSLKQSLVKQSRYAKLFFDKENNLILPMNLTGNVADPAVKVDLSAIRNNFSTNARNLVNDEINREADRLKKRVVGQQLDRAKAELAKKRAEAQRRAEEERKKLEAKRKEAEAKAKARADAEKRKARDAAKKKAKDKLKGKIPGFGS